MSPEPDDQPLEQPVEGDVERFWAQARRQARLETMPGYFGPDAISSVVPPTWSFGTDAAAEELLEQVLSGAVTATSSARSEHGDAPLPHRGDLAILLDGAGHPRALLATGEVSVVPLGEVGADHALAEGAASLEAWLADRDPTDDPVVLERFVVLHPASRSALDEVLGRQP